MEFDRLLEFVEAVEELAQQLGLEVPRDEPAEQRSAVAPVLRSARRNAAKLYQQALREHQARRLSEVGRGLDGETVARTSAIGYAPAGWDFLLKRIGRSTDESRGTAARPRG